MKKRILIDATTVSDRFDGLSQYIINLLKNFPDAAFEKFEFSVLINKGVNNAELGELLSEGKFKVIQEKIAPIGPRRDLDMFRFSRKYKGKFDVFHSTSNQYPICIKNGIATVHDITFERYFDEGWDKLQIARNYLRMVIKKALSCAGSVIAISQSTKNQLIETYGSIKGIENKIEVIYQGWEHVAVDLNKIKIEEQNNYGKYFFYVGTTRKHKNMKKLLEAFCLSVNDLPNINLVLSGSDTYLDKEDLKTIAAINKSGERVIFTGYVSKDKLQSLFRNAYAFIFPSLSEGFGLPVLESFYFEKPLLCSQTTSLPEIAGDAAVYFDPESAEDIGRAMIYIAEHPEIAESLIAKGKERLKKFSWKKTAEETIGIYEKHFAKQQKILHLIYTDGIAGAEMHLLYLLSGLSARGVLCELMIICPAHALELLAEFCEKLKVNGIKVNLIVSEKKYAFANLSKINRYLRRNNISILHSHLIRTDILASLVKQFFFKDLFIISTKHGYQEKKLINYSPDSYNVPGNLYYYATKYTLKKINTNISISHCISRLFVNFKLTNEYYPVISHGVDLTLSKIDDVSFFRRSSPQIIIVGRLEAYKGHIHVFKAMPAVLKKYPDAQLFLIGEGSYRETLTEAARNLGIEKNVQFLGFQKDPYSFLTHSDLLIVPSLFEPFGLVFIEAMALKIPIVAFDVPAGNEIINNNTGFLVPKADCEKLSEQMLYVLENPEACKIIAENAYRVYLERFTTSDMVENTAEFYRSLNSGM